MSFAITTTAGLRTGAIAEAINQFSTNAFLYFWLKITDSGGSDYTHGLHMISNADGSNPKIGVNSYPNRYPWAKMKRAGGSTYDVINTTDQATQSAWQLIWMWWDSTDGSIQVGVGNTTGHTEAGPADWISASPSSVLTAIELGVRRSDDGSSDDFCIQPCLMAMPTIVKRNPTFGVGSEMESLVAGAHPLAVFGDDLVDCWPLNSKTSLLNGYVFVDQGTGGVSIMSGAGDNPTVDDPPEPPPASDNPQIVFMG